MSPLTNYRVPLPIHLPTTSLPLQSSTPPSHPRHRRCRIPSSPLRCRIPRRIPPLPSCATRRHPAAYLLHLHPTPVSPLLPLFFYFFLNLIIYYITVVLISIFVDIIILAFIYLVLGF